MNALSFHGVMPEHRRHYVEATLPLWRHWAALDKRNGDGAAYALSIAMVDELRAELDAREARP